MLKLTNLQTALEQRHRVITQLVMRKVTRSNGIFTDLIKKM